MFTTNREISPDIFESTLCIFPIPVIVCTAVCACMFMEDYIVKPVTRLDCNSVL